MANPGSSDSKEVSALNRIIRWTSKGIEYEADPRQVEKLLVEIELEGANGAVTPGQKVLAHQIETEEELSESDFTLFRGLAGVRTILLPAALMFCTPPRKCVASWRARLLWPWGRSND